eukprot:CAMPEP_0115845690 /NCGR_PEP_ID=MMETSP0287-20121206/9485_1 /TAXON_ID=412157 /ORGANISM="Chrysochromulina rotalis, Strain UIO044" /LENGTH=644 /DNA_ID=CAMNT_0003299477 /DNA_START=71 /DNA_END=2005 /DNA_ORIENTATION=-
MILALLPALACTASQMSLPHVALVLADDFGHANIGYNRRGEPGDASAEVHTPNLDALADAGIILSRHYTYKYCAPSRAALQSGRLPVHVNMENTGVTVMNEADPISGYAGIPRNMTGIATKLRAAGYKTHAVGKWDVGMATPEHTPLGRGYDSWLGYYQHANEYWDKQTSLFSTGMIDNCLNDVSFVNLTNPVTGEHLEGNGFRDLSILNATFRGGVRNAHQLSNTTYEEDVFREQALAIVSAHDTSAPLFLFYSFHLVHTPLQVPAEYLTRIDALVASKGAPPFDTDNRRLYAAMVLYLDEAVGALVDAFREREMWDSTLMVFLADNGGPIYEPGSGNNYPLRGGKYNDFQGGVNANAFLSGGWLPQARRGTIFNGVVHIADWYAMLCGIAGVDSTDHGAAAAGLPAVDGRDLFSAILNDTDGRTDSLHLSPNAVLRWPFKLVTGSQQFGSWTSPRYPNCSICTSAITGRGPEHSDVRVFDVPIPYGPPKVQDSLTWVFECGYEPGCLFNLVDDPTEHVDLASSPEHAEIARELADELAVLNSTLFEPTRGTPSLDSCLRGIDIGRFYGPWAHVPDGWYTPLPPSTPTQQAKDDELKAVLTKLNQPLPSAVLIKSMHLTVPLVSFKVIFPTIDTCRENGTSPR